MSHTELAPARRGSATPEETRRRIEDVAEALFRRIGYQKTAVADIARELGMSPANVYRFYASKSAINEAIATRMLSGVAEELWGIARQPAPAEARLALLLRTLHQRHMALFFTERRLHDMVTAAMAEHWDCVERFITAVQGAIRHVIMDGIAAGQFHRADPEVLARSVKQACMAFVHPVIIAECIGRATPEAQLAAELEEVIALVLRGLKA
jgi:AcrR family transcriptional regulator